MSADVHGPPTDSPFTLEACVMILRIQNVRGIFLAGGGEEREQGRDLERLQEIVPWSQ